VYAYYSHMCVYVLTLVLFNLFCLLPPSFFVVVVPNIFVSDNHNHNHNNNGISLSFSFLSVVMDS
jgi:hypothetical protein